MAGVFLSLLSFFSFWREADVLGSLCEQNVDSSEEEDWDIGASLNSVGEKDAIFWEISGDDNGAAMMDYSKAPFQKLKISKYVELLIPFSFVSACSNRSVFCGFLDASGNRSSVVTFHEIWSMSKNDKRIYELPVPLITSASNSTIYTWELENKDVMAQRENEIDELLSSRNGSCTFKSNSSHVPVLSTTLPCGSNYFTLYTALRMRRNTTFLRLPSFTGHVLSDIRLSSSSFSSLWSPNGQRFVSTSGNDSILNCGESLSSACLTIGKAYQISQPGDVIVVEAGNYVEKKSISLKTTLSIAGRSAGECKLSKDSTVQEGLFNLTTHYVELTIAEITIVLADNVPDSYFVLCIAAANVTFVKCHVCTESEGSGEIFGQNILINNSLASLSFTNCRIFNITSSVYAFVYCDRTDKLLVLNCSFVNVKNTHSSEDSSCFRANNAKTVNLEQSVFVACDGGRVGYADLGLEGSVDSCTFWNNTAGALHMKSVSVIDSVTVYITNSSFVICTSATDGGALYLMTLVQSTLTECSFINCSGRIGGALFLSYKSSASLLGCVFVGNMASTEIGNDADIGLRCQLTIDNNTFTSKAELATSLSVEDEDLTGNMLYSSDYNSTDCIGTFGANQPDKEGRCRTPCVASPENDACVLPTECPASYVGVNGKCVLECAFWSVADKTSEENACGANCAYDTSLGFPLCVECTSLVAHASSSTYPCGVANCYQQVNTNGNELTTCGPDCPIYALPLSESGRCIFIPCPERMAGNVTSTYPCLTFDCFQQLDSTGDLLTTCASVCKPEFAIPILENGTCGFAACIDRVPDSFGCGPSCYAIEDGGGCVDDCAEAGYVEDSLGVCVKVHGGGKSSDEEKSKGLSKTTIIVIIISVSVVALMVGIILVICHIARRNRSYILFEFPNLKEYAVERNLGEGSCGEVWLIKKDETEHAVKIVKLSNSVKAEVEASKLLHENPYKYLVRINETCKNDKGKVCIVMEYCPEGDLSKTIQMFKRQEGRFSVERAMRMLVQMLLAINHLHSLGILHRDLKPGNIFVDEEIQLRIGDFGASTLLDPKNPTTQGQCGTLCYMPPEMWTAKPYGFSADMWAVGVTMYEILALKLPFESSDQAVLKEKIKSGRFEPILAGIYPRALEEVVESLLKVNPAERPTAKELLQSEFIRQYAGQFNLLEDYPEGLK